MTRLQNLRKAKRLSRQRREIVCPTLIWKYFGDFEKIKTVPKYAARLGLLISATRHAEFIEDGKWQLEKDIVHHGCNFTDGCGRMSTQLAQRFTLNKHCANRYKHQSFEVPSIVQIRFMGCKGILVHDPSLDFSGKDVILRESQKKFEWNFNTIKGRLKYTEKKQGRTGRLLGICRGGESKPFVFGRLNKQFVLVLSALGIPNTTLLEIQNEYFELVKSRDAKFLIAIYNYCAFYCAMSVLFAMNLNKDFLSKKSISLFYGAIESP
ncbi:unnamed protein product [Oikopleura dioica]|uniref:RNA-dependent RNA polymerase n=1 Tax=Oikopleura dioica TaxID=34765 RepID=E4YWP2_OIKDI|nr:unnamed protein product [Oikopleura dioica]